LKGIEHFGSKCDYHAYRRVPEQNPQFQAQAFRLGLLLFKNFINHRIDFRSNGVTEWRV